MFILQKGWDLINKKSKKNKHFNWRWSGVGIKHVNETIAINTDELAPIVSELKEKARKKKNNPTKARETQPTNLRNVKFSEVSLENQQKVSLLYQYNGKKIHLGQATIQSTIAVSKRAYPSIKDVSEFIVLSIDSMEMPFEPMYNELKWAMDEEVTSGSIIPWYRNDIVLLEEVQREKGNKQVLVHFDEEDLNLMNSQDSSLVHFPVFNNNLQEKVNALTKALEEEMIERKH